MNQAQEASRQAPALTAAVLRERIYGGIAGLSTLLVLLRYTETDGSAWTAVIDVAIATGGLWAASLFADYVRTWSRPATSPSASGARAFLSNRPAGGKPPVSAALRWRYGARSGAGVAWATSSAPRRPARCR
jgi:hypothetical protein